MTLWYKNATIFFCSDRFMYIYKYPLRALRVIRALPCIQKAVPVAQV